MRFFALNSAAIQSDGKIVVWWCYNSTADETGAYSVRLNSDWSRDTSFIIGSGFNGCINSVAINDGQILLWWWFTTYQWIGAGYLVALLWDQAPAWSLPVFLSDTQIIAYLLKTKKTADPKWLFMGTIPLYF
jgi:hypothetical protein